ncbi:hypothetical protein SAMN02787148_1369 [Burkholderia vietnamiensis]|nr:hypothetical protein EC918_1229 [Burkholderia vietnamiensis]SCZ46684.1 hypothetical protein SAMN02787148_1369 [Burkholderia vietnamiensis]SFY39918.1 hypothetical protein SAMN02787160_13614 [Burkholderia vietnamiensis]
MIIGIHHSGGKQVFFNLQNRYYLLDWIYEFISLRNTLTFAHHNHAINLTRNLVADTHEPRNNSHIEFVERHTSQYLFCESLIHPPNRRSMLHLKIIQLPPFTIHNFL